MSDTPAHVPSVPSPQGTPTPRVIAGHAQDARLAPPRPRLWPAVVIVGLQWFFILLPRWVELPMMMMIYVLFFGPMIAAAAIALWWLFASRLWWRDRLVGLGIFAGAGALTALVCHPSFQMGIFFHGLPIVTTAWVGWLVLTPFLQWPTRRAGLLLVLVLAWVYCTLLRFDGTDGSLVADWNWRWTNTNEELYLAELEARKPGTVPATNAAAAEVLTLQPGDWPGFRGPHRDGRLSGVQIATDWKLHPPRLLWRHRVGPGWSSFTVVGHRLYTQEQRGEEEVVVCYDAGSGAELWTHQDTARFTETLGGPGPRATPTFDGGRLYTLGATGRLNCLDPVTGRVIWTRDIAADAAAKVPMWGFSASPLVVQGIVTVFAGGPEGKGVPKDRSVLGYHARTGEPAWTAAGGEFTYSSTQLAQLGGIEQLLLLTDSGLTSYEPASGEVLWEHAWKLPENMWRAVQPAILNDSDVLIGTWFDWGTRRVRVSREEDKWSTQEIWTTRAIKPYFNDFVVYKDHLYGFDNAFFTCVRLEDGKATWRERGYANGQVLLLADQGLLLILSEKGEVALVEARPAARLERARFKAIGGKTWNHPVIAHGKLFVRNGEEAACYQLAGTDDVQAARK